ncbi:hypothetical protein M422DRAFT_84658, partial [Sphaerobolus stellatus SS14]
RTVQFTNEGRSLVITYLETSNIAMWSVNPWAKKWERSVTNISFCSGFSRISPDGLSILIDNVRNGTDAYHLRNGQYITMFHGPVTGGKVKQVAYNGDGSLVIQGSDKGIVYISDFTTTAPVQTLMHSTHGELVQAIT